MANLYEIGSSGVTEHFTIEEAAKLLNSHVVRKVDFSSEPAIELFGFVAGVITLNDDVEILIKFLDVMEQVPKPDYLANYIELPISLDE